MGDQSGPGRKRCWGVGIVDLVDVEGFDSPPEDNKLYGLEFGNGVYRRQVIEIPEVDNNNLGLDPAAGVQDKIYGFKFKNNSYTQEEIKPGELENLSNVNFQDAQPNVKYSLLKNTANKWVVIKQPNWIVDLSITPQNTFVGKQHRLKKIINNGAAFISYISNRKNGIYVYEKDNEYYLQRSNEVGLSTAIFLEMLEEFRELNYKVNRQSTILIELFLLGPAPDEFLTILPGVKIKWTANEVNKSVKIYIRGSTTTASLSGVTFENTPTIKIDKIGFHTSVLFKRLLYTNETVPPEYLTSL